MNKTKKTNKTSMWQRRLGRQQRHRNKKTTTNDGHGDGDGDGYSTAGRDGVEMKKEEKVLLD